MDILQAMAVFKRVVDASSFSKAADSLEIPRASVSTLVQNLESHLGVRLLNRTTRSVQVTDDGALHYEYCARILAEVSDAESALSNKRQNPRGTIRVDTSATFAANVLVPVMRDFNARYPDNTVKLGLEDPRIHALILGYWHTIVTPPMVFAKNMVEVKNAMKAKGIEKPIVASLAGDIEVEEAADYLYQNGIVAYAYSTEIPVAVLGAKYKWARGAGLL